jgi:carbohydrate diacid regulator
VISIATGFHRSQDDLWSYICHGTIAMLKAGGRQQLRAWLAAGPPAARVSSSNPIDLAAQRAAEALLAHLEPHFDATFQIGVGRLYPGPAGLASSAKDARIALDVGRVLHSGGHRESRVYPSTSLGIDAFARTCVAPARHEFACRLLAPLDAEPELRQTLEAFFEENCAVGASASKLHLHRNTLGYRLDKIAQLTGLDPRSFEDAVQMRIALQIVLEGAFLQSPKGGNQGGSRGGGGNDSERGFAAP